LSHPTLRSTSALTLSFPLDRVKKENVRGTQGPTGDGSSVYAHALRRGTLVVCAQQRKPTKNASPRAEQRNLPPPHYGIGERGLTPKNATTVPSLRAAREFKKSKLWKIQSNGNLLINCCRRTWMASQYALIRACMYFIQSGLTSLSADWRKLSVIK